MLADAEAICEGVSRKTMRFVPVKSAEQQGDAMLLKVRDLLVRQQTQAINALRAHLHELGIIPGAGVAKVSQLIDIARDQDDCRAGAEPPRPIACRQCNSLPAGKTVLQYHESPLI